MFQVGFQRVVDAVGEVGGGHRHGELHELPFRKVLPELGVEGLVRVHLGGELLGVAEDQPLQLAVRGVGGIVGEAVDLVLRESDPLTEGRVVSESVVAVIHL